MHTTTSTTPRDAEALQAEASSAGLSVWDVVAILLAGTFQVLKTLLLLGCVLAAGLVIGGALVVFLFGMSALFGTVTPA